MGLFDRRKREEPKPDVAKTEADEVDGDEEQLDGPATWYRTMDLAVVPAGDDVLLHDPERATPIVLPAFELDLLAQCTHFAPVEAHAEAAERRTGLPALGVAQRLYELVDRGLLVSQHEIIVRARAAAEADTDAPPTLARVAVITSDRPASLATCLRSYRDRYGSDIELVVFDDSADAASRAENQRVAAQAAAGGRIFYAGEDEKSRFVTELAARSGVERDVVRAAVVEFDGCAWHTGANRNAALLDAAGGAVLMVDDDTTARAALPDAANDGLRLSSRFNPWAVRFFVSVEEALSAANWQDADILSWHRRFLGRSPALCAFGRANSVLPLEAGSLALDLNEADAALLSVFSRGRGRVAVTSAGVAGDSGMGLVLSFLALEGQARERLLEDYEAHRVTRAVHRSVDVATVSSTPLLMTTHVGFDVRATIPPFPPVLRNEDGVFGNLLRMCAAESYIAFLPWRIEHTLADVRTVDFDHALESITHVRANDIICDIVRAYEPSHGVADPAKRLSAFGRYLAALGVMPTADFNSFVRYQIVVAVGRRIEALTRAVDQHDGKPERWAEDCATVMAEGLRVLTEDKLVVADIPGATPDERHRRFQRLLLRYGRLLDAWPTLLDAAKHLRVAEPLTT